MNKAFPVGCESAIRMRSSLALMGDFIPNAPSTIDSDYRGELYVIDRGAGGFGSTGLE